MCTTKTMMQCTMKRIFVLWIAFWFPSDGDSESGPQYPNHKVRLVGGTSSAEGRVEVFYNNTWGTVCDDNLFKNTVFAGVICVNLGFPRDGAQSKVEAFYGEGQGPIWLDNVQCDGNESHIADCRHDGWGISDCRHLEDAGVYCNKEPSLQYRNHTVRLVGGSSSLEGRVEVFYDNRWGTVCDKYFDDKAAAVVCAMFGFYRTGAQLKKGGSYGQGTGVIWLDEVRCHGNETDLAFCQHNTSETSNCGHSQDIGVKCDVRETVRLAGTSSSYQGRLEVFYDNQWGTVCDDNFDNNAAAVVCAMLGFPRNGVKYLRYYGTGRGVIWLDNVQCDGNESHIADCSHNGWGVNDCSHSEDVGFKCIDDVSGPRFPDLTPRLVAGNTSSEGRLELFFDNRWGTVCDDHFDNNTAAVVCAMFGFPRDGAESKIMAFYGNGQGFIWLDNVRCNGNESHIADCHHNGWGISDCGHSEDVGVYCEKGPQDGKQTVRLVGGNTSSEGRVEVFHDNLWGTVCHHFFDNKAAAVVCAMLDFPREGARYTKPAFFGEGSGLIWLDNVQCNGNESDIVDCNHNEWAVNDCGYFSEVGVYCNTGNTSASNGTYTTTNHSESTTPWHRASPTITSVEVSTAPWHRSAPSILLVEVALVVYGAFCRPV